MDVQYLHLLKGWGKTSRLDPLHLSTSASYSLPFESSFSWMNGSRIYAPIAYNRTLPHLKLDKTKQHALKCYLTDMDVAWLYFMWPADYEIF